MPIADHQIMSYFRWHDSCKGPRGFNSQKIQAEQCCWFCEKRSGQSNDAQTTGSLSPIVPIRNWVPIHAVIKCKTIILTIIIVLACDLGSTVDDSKYICLSPCLNLQSIHFVFNNKVKWKWNTISWCLSENQQSSYLIFSCHVLYSC